MDIFVSESFDVFGKNLLLLGQQFSEGFVLKAYTYKCVCSVPDKVKFVRLAQQKCTLSDWKIECVFKVRKISTLFRRVRKWVGTSHMLTARPFN